MTAAREVKLFDDTFAPGGVIPQEVWARVPNRNRQAMVSLKWVTETETRPRTTRKRRKRTRKKAA